MGFASIRDPRLFTAHQESVRAVSRAWPQDRTANFRLRIWEFHPAHTSGELQSSVAQCVKKYMVIVPYTLSANDLPMNTSGISGVDLPAHHKFLEDGQQVPANWRFVQAAAYVLLSLRASENATACA